MKMESLRRAYGIAEPVRRGMELKIVRDGTFRPAALGGVKGGNVHEDILVLGGRDSEVGWEEIFQGTFSLLLTFSVCVLIGGLFANFGFRWWVPGTAYLPRWDGEAIEDGLLNLIIWYHVSFSLLCWIAVFSVDVFH
jgi:Proteasome maturation factor UMP1